MPRTHLGRTTARMLLIAAFSGALLTPTAATPAPAATVEEDCAVMWDWYDYLDEETKKHAREDEWPGTGWVSAGEEEVPLSQGHTNFESGYAASTHDSCGGGVGQG